MTPRNQLAKTVHEIARANKASLTSKEHRALLAAALELERADDDARALGTTLSRVCEIATR